MAFTESFFYEHRDLNKVDQTMRPICSSSTRFQLEEASPFSFLDDPLTCMVGDTSSDEGESTAFDDSNEPLPLDDSSSSSSSGEDEVDDTLKDDEEPSSVVTEEEKEEKKEMKDDDEEEEEEKKKVVKASSSFSKRKPRNTNQRYEAL
jgi:hypothetical protein